MYMHLNYEYVTSLSLPSSLPPSLPPPLSFLSLSLVSFFSFLFQKISVVRPPNFTVMLIWIPLLILAAVVGYFKRENLHMLYDSRLWATFAMV